VGVARSPFVEFWSALGEIFLDLLHFLAGLRKRSERRIGRLGIANEEKGFCHSAAAE